jgi:hypothetical protein
MTTKKQTKTKKEKQATVVEPTHKNPEVLKDLYQKQKMSAGQIAKMFKVSRATVLFQMRKHGIKITTRKTKSANAKEDYKKADWLRKQISQGVSYVTVRNQAMKLVDAQTIEAGRELRKKQKAEAKGTHPGPSGHGRGSGQSAGSRELRLVWGN